MNEVDAFSLAPRREGFVFELTSVVGLESIHLLLQIGSFDSGLDDIERVLSILFHER